MARVAPSDLNSLSECQLRVAFQKDPRFSSLQRPSTASAMGVAAHALTEDVYRRKVPTGVDIATWLEARWKLRIDEQFVKLQVAWPGRSIPEPQHWRGFNVVRVRLLRRLRVLAGELPPAAPRKTTADWSDSQRSWPFPWVERHLSDELTRLHGSPDLVEEVDGVIRVVDLKSGLEQADMTEGQRRQLLIYAHLVRATSGELPRDAVIRTANGHENGFEIVRAEVDSQVRAAQEALDTFNAAVEQHHIPANPMPAVCRWCPFRVECSDYWSSRDENWLGEDIHGVVVAVRGASVIDVERLDRDPTSIYTLHLAEGVERPPQGSHIVVLDVDASGAHSGSMRWNSALRVDANGN